MAKTSLIVPARIIALADFAACLGGRVSESTILRALLESSDSQGVGAEDTEEKLKKAGYSTTSRSNRLSFARNFLFRTTTLHLATAVGPQRYKLREAVTKESLAKLTENIPESVCKAFASPASVIVFLMVYLHDYPPAAVTPAELPSFFSGPDKIYAPANSTKAIVAGITRMTGPMLTEAVGLLHKPGLVYTYGAGSKGGIYSTHSDLVMEGYQLVEAETTITITPAEAFNFLVALDAYLVGLG